VGETLQKIVFAHDPNDLRFAPVFLGTESYGGDGFSSRSRSAGTVKDNATKLAKECSGPRLEKFLIFRLGKVCGAGFNKVADSTPVRDDVDYFSLTRKEIRNSTIVN